MSQFDGVTLEEAKQWLREHVEKGATCPCCNQNAKIYKRQLTSVAARTMIRMWQTNGCDWIHVPTLLKTQLPDIAHQGGYATLGQHWKLIAESTEEREDGGRAGWWHLTSRGEFFVRHRLTVSKYARVYDNRVLSYAGDSISIIDALGTKFDYNDLMGE